MSNTNYVVTFKDQVVNLANAAMCPTSRSERLLGVDLRIQLSAESADVKEAASALLLAWANKGSL